MPANWPGYDNPTLGYTYNSNTMTVSIGFENKLVKKAKAKLEGTKTMVGAKLSQAQFTFNAKLIRVNSTDVTYWKSFANGNVSDPVQSDQVMNFINESTNKFEVKMLLLGITTERIMIRR